MNIGKTMTFECPHCGHSVIGKMSMNQALTNYRSCPECGKECDSGISTCFDDGALAVMREKLEK